MSARRGRVSRRGLLAGAGLGLAASALECASFRGAFDHRRPLAASAAERYRASLEALTALSVAVVHVAHSTHLLAIGGRRFLTDPWFYDPAFGALVHEVSPAVTASAIGAIDGILITHDHADHADLRALDEMDKRAAVVVATSELAGKVRARGFGDVGVLGLWEERRFGEVRLVAVPGLHDIYEIGYVLTEPSGVSMYFAGDSRLHPDLPAIAERFAPRLAILPVDGTRLVGGALHVMTPEDAIVAARQLRVSVVVPSHSEALFSDPLAKHVLASMVPQARSRFAALVESSLPGVRCAVPLPGELVRLAADR
jgi:L-ascorbate metabolism protein UlaG (beta-lactamase superfamily)